MNGLPIQAKFCLALNDRMTMLSGGDETGAEDRTRTDDLLITNQLLYQLSYFGLLLDCIVAALEGKVGP